MYNSLNETQRLVVPIVFFISFIYFYFKYRYENIPKILLYSNIILALGSITLFFYELLKQNNYENVIDNMINPFRLMDLWMFIYAVGAICVLYGCSIHPKYKDKKIPLYFLKMLFLVIVISYIAGRIIVS